jgi:hypothetical protein
MPKIIERSGMKEMDHYLPDDTSSRTFCLINTVPRLSERQVFSKFNILALTLCV